MKFTTIFLFLTLFVSLVALNHNCLEPSNPNDETVSFIDNKDKNTKPNVIDCIKIVDDENPEGDFA